MVDLQINNQISKTTNNQLLVVFHSLISKYRLINNYRQNAYIMID
jgi:hypothetical protein